MIRNKLFMALVVSSFLIVPTLASADSDTKPSYANKKSGHVAFKSEEKTSDDAAASAQDMNDPSKIEPAAGTEETSDTQDENNLADDLKLPRKN